MFQGVQTLTLAPRRCTTKAVFTLCAHAHAQNSATFRHQVLQISKYHQVQQYKVESFVPRHSNVPNSSVSTSKNGVLGESTQAPFLGIKCEHPQYPYQVNKLIHSFSRMGFLKNFFQFVFLDKFKYSFCKLRKQPFHVIALVNCNALHKTNMPTVRGQHHGNH